MSPEKVQRGEFLEVVQGYIHVGKELTDFQRLLKDWFFTCIVLGTIFFYALQIGIILGWQLYWEYQRGKILQQEEEVNWEDNASENLDLDGITDTGSHSGNVPGDDVNRQDYTQAESGVENNTGPHIVEQYENQNNNDAVFFECDGSFDDRYDGDEWEDLPTQTTTTTATSSNGNVPGVTTRIPDENWE
jgi:hypothetical protein